MKGASLVVAIASSAMLLLSLTVQAIAQQPATPAAAPTAPPTAAGVREVEVTIGSGEWAVPAILALPAENVGPYPVAVLMHGFGPGTLDGDVGPNKVMRETAIGLAQRGVAALRMAKRSTTHSRRFREEQRHATVGEEWIDDTVAAVTLLRSTAGIDAGRIYVVGHSASGGMAPLVANLTGVAGAVMVNGSLRDAPAMIEDQMNYVTSLSSEDSPESRQQRAEMEAGLRLLRDPNAAGETRALGHPLWYWRSLARIDAQEEVQALTERGAEFLVVQGERDYLTTDADWAVLNAAFTGHPRVTLRRFPRLNHMMQDGEGRMTPAEYRWQKPVAREWTDALSEWISSRPVRTRLN
ncbi:alpha/beta hydrolase family protein [Sphingosinicella terrae]|uniref:alpha/beta hydrolase family protein n=1 Tax=Sphingosinicella terrae TaxID=2172047 RepID=UPI000E0D79EB|nr:alpha/beta hydrolase fold domain-containing protein [Sphingosinicella terrae]